MKRCLFCYKELNDNEMDFHPSCAAKIFGTKIPPVLPYSRSEISKLAEQVLRSQTTVTGVQAKLSLDLEKDKESRTQRFTIVGLWGRFILKPQADFYQHLPELEDVTMHLAELSGIKVVPHSLIRFPDGELCYITRRIDRTSTGEKIQMEDFCQLSEKLTEYKYKGSYEQIAKLIKKYSDSPYLDLANFWEIVVFSFVIGNSDMHLKNFSLFENSDGKYSLTPAYDLISTKLVMPADTEELALTLNAKKRKLTKSDFVVAMENSGLNGKTIQNIFTKITESKESWFSFIDSSFLPDEMKNNYKKLIVSNFESIR
ncbi:MAG: HipA domain-containing protein [Bacteroidales bacterium]|nr:HipA domain-containing protein [Bacteroidales bacterium]